MTASILQSKPTASFEIPTCQTVTAGLNYLVVLSVYNPSEILSWGFQDIAKGHGGLFVGMVIVTALERRNKRLVPGIWGHPGTPQRLWISCLHDGRLLCCFKPVFFLTSQGMFFEHDASECSLQASIPWCFSGVFKYIYDCDSI